MRSDVETRVILTDQADDSPKLCPECAMKGERKKMKCSKKIQVELFPRKWVMRQIFKKVNWTTFLLQV